MNYRKILTCAIFVIFIPLPLCAEILTLKSGQAIEGKIISRNAKEIKIDFAGVTLTYFIEDIDSIDGIPIDLPAGRPDKIIPVRRDNEPQQEPKNIPDDTDSVFYQGVASVKKGDFDQAIAYFTKVITTNPGLAEAYYNRGVMYMKKNSLDQAISDFSKAVQLRPAYAQVFNNRAVAYYNKKEYAKSWEDVRRAESLGFAVNLDFIDSLKRASETKKP